jgi:predicted SnoaL-like aldol condensation-catalyzing enzyme
MTKEHPKITLLSKIDILDLSASSHLFSEAFVWHYFNPNSPDVQGDYIGIEGLKNFFKSLAGKTNGTFKVNVVSATPIGEELVVVHVRNTMEHDGNSITIDAVVVWRIVSGRFAEAWDIPSAFTVAT